MRLNMPKLRALTGTPIKAVGPGRTGSSGPCPQPLAAVLWLSTKARTPLGVRNEVRSKLPQPTEEVIKFTPKIMLVELPGVTPEVKVSSLAEASFGRLR